jgi:HEAT repeat protein
MKLMTPSLPGGWQYRTLEDGTVHAIARRSSGCATSLLCLLGAAPLLLIPFLRVYPSEWSAHWLLALIFLSFGALFWWRHSSQEWLLSAEKLRVRTTFQGKVVRQVTFPQGELSIAGGGYSVWELILHHRGRARRLHSSASLTDVVAFSAFLQHALGWREVETDLLPSYVRPLVEHALMMGSPELTRPLLDEPRVLPLLTEMWREDRTLFRPRLLTLFATLEKETARLTQLVATGTPELQCCAVEILGEMEDGSVLPVLRRALESSVETVRRRAVVALGQRRDAESVPALCRLVQTVPEFRQASAWALGEIGDAAAVSVLADFLTQAVLQGEVPACQAAATALGRIKDPRSVPALAAALVDRVAAVRESAVEALAMVGHPTGVPPLIRAMGDPERAVATRAVTALGRVGHPSASTDLCRVLANGGLDLRSRAAAALGEIGGTAAVDALCQALDDPDAVVCFQVVSALKRLAPRRQCRSRFVPRSHVCGRSVGRYLQRGRTSVKWRERR